MANEETVRYWGESEAERQAAFDQDVAARTAGGWRAADKRTEFAFGKPGMDLVVRWVQDGEAQAPATGDAVPAPVADPAPSHFDLNAAIVRATTATADTAPAASAASAASAAASAAPSTRVARVAAPAAIAASAASAAIAASAAPQAPAAVQPPAQDVPPDIPEPERPVEESAPDTGDGGGFSPAEARRLFGKYGEDVSWLLDLLPGVDPTTADEIAQAYGRIDEDARTKADMALRGYDGDPAAEQMQAAEDLVEEWADTTPKHGNAKALYEIVASAALDAVDALILQDRLDEDDFDTLYTPWGSVMDEEDADDEAAEAGAADAWDEPEGDDTGETDTPDAESEAPAEPEEPEEPAAAEEDAAEFGPNESLVLEFFETLRGLSLRQIERLGEAPAGDDPEALDGAWARLTTTSGERARWREQCEAVGREVTCWRTGETSPHFDYSSVEGTPADRESAATSVVEAATALLMADLIEHDDAELLYQAWNRVVGRPELPEYQDRAPDEAAGDAEDPLADEEDAAEFGPNTDLVVEFFTTLAAVTPQQAERLGQRGASHWKRMLQDARNERDETAGERRRWREQCDAAGREVDCWAARRKGLHADYSGGDVTVEARSAASLAATDAVTALVMADLLEREDVEMLYWAWQDAVGRPELPQYADE